MYLNGAGVIFSEARKRVYIKKTIKLPSKSVGRTVADSTDGDSEKRDGHEEAEAVAKGVGEPTAKKVELQMVLEHNPKWSVLTEVLDEIGQLIRESDKKRDIVAPGKSPDFDVYGSRYIKILDHFKSLRSANNSEQFFICFCFSLIDLTLFSPT
tara:strand:- start:336 stop:797 length:462 start_codon:yes stop_codon:yes gene_type:complete